MAGTASTRERILETVLFCGEFINLVDGTVHAAHLPEIDAEGDEKADAGTYSYLDADGDTSPRRSIRERAPAMPRGTDCDRN